ncbi:hypothetical protein GGTG_04717 [Gaeumannomyces tritici R3-111a-1]|uniref:F-box domain-containing protein n=1 Tax=Gaeumannomyces tritici (strain R3-111a-1) TaxID=644352 RepID=J3NTW8_GAET3|nr:hypothetical protein GGTG_04717 [Gaeumannomyces tritici R3-111a-1]EJT79633.1 hypothetical protein GGTG_04717 [Gaeumannomyces tritici R3-111a-1]
MWLIRFLPRELFDGILDLQNLARLSSACHDLGAIVAPPRRYGIFVRRLKIVVSSLGCTNLGCTNPDCDYDWDCSPDTEAYYAVANPENGGIPARSWQVSVALCKTRRVQYMTH